MTIPLFVTCLSGLEDVLQDELSTLDYSSDKGGGGVWVPVDAFTDVMHLNYKLRTASRVLLPLFDIEKPSRERLYQEIYDSDVYKFFPEMFTFCVDVPFAKHPAFNNTHFIAQLVKDAICDRLKKEQGSRPSIDTKNPDVRFSLVVMPNKATFYFDTSGDALFKRGYRAMHVEAPLKENLAAALLMLSGYTKDKIFVDPCCGSGTFLIEAAFMATNTPSQYFRKKFGFFKHPLFREEAWNKIVQEAEVSIQRNNILPIYGIEQDDRTYMHLRKALSEAKFQNVVTTFLGSFQNVSLPKKPSFLISNPPFGVRLGRPEEHKDLYKDLGGFIKTQLDRPAQAALLSNSVDLLRNVALPSKKTLPIFHGGLDCFFSLFELA